MTAPAGSSPVNIPSAALSVLSCPAPLGQGGLGRHGQELLELAARLGVSSEIFSAPGPKHRPQEIARPWSSAASGTLLRLVPGLMEYLGGVEFDHHVARALPSRLEGFTGFAGAARRSLELASRRGAEVTALVAANSHVLNVSTQHGAAQRRDPIEGTWLSPLFVRRTLWEYQAADLIIVASDYTERSFLARGFSPERLVRMCLSADARFAGVRREPDPERFTVVYVGALSVAKGVPVLVDAFAKLDDPWAQLVLVGGWGTRGMRRWLTRRMAEDTRITVVPGDPLPWLRRAHVVAHPSWEDGFAYAVAEAMAAGVPVVVSDHTGAAELVVEDVNGWVVPAGDPEALAERLRLVRSAQAGRVADGGRA